MRTLSSVAASALVLAAALLARDQAVSPGAAKQGKAGLNPARQVAEQVLRQMDTNQDGEVSRGEFTSYPDYFDRLDANKDGFIVLAEIRPGMANLLRKDVPYVPPPRASTGLVPLTDLKTGTPPSCLGRTRRCVRSAFDRSVSACAAWDSRAWPRPLRQRKPLCRPSRM
jgi:hypothetical protein